MGTPFIFALLIASAYGSPACTEPSIEVTGFTTLDATIVNKVAFVADFVLSCANSAKDISLYAETNVGMISVARTVDGARYQISWTEEANKASKGSHEIRLYDEASYAALKKSSKKRRGKRGASHFVRYLSSRDL